MNTGCAFIAVGGMKQCARSTKPGHMHIRMHMVCFSKYIYQISVCCGKRFMGLRIYVESSIRAECFDIGCIDRG